MGKKVEQLASGVVIEANETEAKWATFLIRHRNKFFYSFLAAILIMAGLYRITNSRTLGKQRDFSQAEYDFVQATATHAGSAEALSNLERTIDKHDELRAKYDAPLAQSLLQSDQAALATQYGQRAIERVQDHMPEYADFAATTLLISQGNYEAALYRATELQAKLSRVVQKDDSHGHLLKDHNLLRIAMLEQKIGTPAAERQAWTALLSELEAAQTEGPAQRFAADKLLEAFTEGRITLHDYAKSRLQA